MNVGNDYYYYCGCMVGSSNWSIVVCDFEEAASLSVARGKWKCGLSCLKPTFHDSLLPPQQKRSPARRQQNTLLP
eukprot:scaffold1294_cov167-Amphora_coffeaeformis.AAC.11